jgi:phage baseplate assembly protein W
MLEVAFPFHLDDRGRTATTSYEEHVEQMLELLLFTRPGERVNRPDFGCGLLDMVFAPNSPEIAAALNITITAAIAQWLGDVISLTSLDVTADDNRLTVFLSYTVLATGAAAELTLSVPGTA